MKSGYPVSSQPLFLSLFGVDNTFCLSAGFVDEISHSLCKLLVAIGDHSTSYLAANLASTTPASFPAYTQPLASGSQPTNGHLVQAFLKLLMTYTTLPGFYGQDEEDSEMTLGFWFLFQEALWSTDYHFEELEETARERDDEGALWDIAKAVYSELVRGLRRKVMWPAKNVQNGWAKGGQPFIQYFQQKITFQWLSYSIYM